MRLQVGVAAGIEYGAGLITVLVALASIRRLSPPVRKEESLFFLIGHRASAELFRMYFGSGNPPVEPVQRLQALSGGTENRSVKRFVPTWSHVHRLLHAVALLGVKRVRDDAD